MNKRAQATIFIIVALAIIALFLLLLFLTRGNIFVNLSDTINPEVYLRDCISPTVKDNVAILAKNGGYAEPLGYLEYHDERVKYLCYTAEDYKTCIVQQALIKEQFEKDLNSLTKAKADECFDSLKSEYEKRGYTVNGENNKVKFSIVPQSIKYTVSGLMNIRKGTESRSFNGFDVEIDSQLYDLLLISVSIIDFEATYGDSETTSYLQFYPNLKIEKIRLSEGSKIYRVSNVVTNEEFTFATRSLVFPPGYGIS